MADHGFRFGSVCSGIEAASVAWHPLGWKAAWLAEIEPFPAAVLAHHYPEVPNLGDMTKIARSVLTGDVEAPDVLVGGTPCQAFSVAGLREGLADARGQLTIKYVELADAIDFIRGRRGQQPAIVVWGNVPGVLSSKDNAFGCFLAALAGEDDEIKPLGEKWANAGCVFGPTRTVAWRVLDAQYFGVAQRRRRVFVVASARKDFDPAAVLFEFDGLRRDTAPSREARQETAGTLASRTGAGGKPIGYRMAAFGEYANDETASTMKARDYKDATDLAVQCVTGDITHTLKAEGFDASEDCTGRGQPIVPVAFPANLSGTQCASAVDVAPSMGAKNPTAVAYAHVDIMPTMVSGGSTDASHSQMSGQFREDYIVPHGLAVRRLTPTECERLQGFPDGYTRIPSWDGWRKMDEGETPEQLAAEGLEVKHNKKTGKWRVKDVDGPRYKALGNSMAVPCMAFIGRRIKMALGLADNDNQAAASEVAA